MTAVPQRGQYQGVLQILRFNWPKYLGAAACATGAGFALPLLPPLDRIVLLAAVLSALFWMVASLLVSHYVYDRSLFYELSWLSRALEHNPRRWLNIHCGFDETSPQLAAQFTGASGEVVDIFDARAMTENSIRQARRAQRNRGYSKPACFYALPFDAGDFGAIFCIFAAHELRRHADRMRLFTEIARLLTPGGAFLLVEHLRDWPNFLAFGPGFLHFHSWRAWQRAARGAGLAVQNNFSFTPFVRVAVLRREL